MHRWMVGLAVAVLCVACGSKNSATPEDASGKEQGGSGAGEDVLLEPGDELPASGSGFAGIIEAVTPQNTVTPVAAATVSVLGASVDAQATTAADGTFALTVPDGTYWLLAQADGHWGSVEFWAAPDNRTSLPLLRADGESSLVGMAAAKGAALDATKGIVEVSITDFDGALPAGLTLNLASEAGAILLDGEGGTYSRVTELPASEEGFLALHLLDVTPGKTTVQVTGPDGTNCSASLPEDGSFHVAPRAVTSLFIGCD